MELGFANALNANKNGCRILDGTLDGFGRGAGNVRTELLSVALVGTQKIKNKSDFNEAICDVQNFMKRMREKYSWGPTAPYILGASNKLPQSSIMELIELRRLNSLDIVSLAEQKKKPLFLLQLHYLRNRFDIKLRRL